MTATTTRERLGALASTPLVWGLVAIVVLLAINSLRDPGYLGVELAASGRLAGNPIDILRTAAPLLMIALGMTLVVATGGIDLSVGSAMVIGGAVSMEMLQAGDGSVGSAMAALGVALLITAVLGAINGVLVAFVGLQPFITTLVTMLAGRGLAKVITEGQNTSASNEAFRWIANGTVLGAPVVFLIALAILVVVVVLVRTTALGMLIESIGIDPKASRMAGVDRRSLLVAVYVISGVLGGVAGVFATGSVMTVDVSNTGLLLELDAILAVVVGGTALTGGRFSLAGAAIGALLIATLDKTVVFLGVSSAATPAFKAVVIVALCLLQSATIRERLSRVRLRAPRREVTA